jgi:hypothetical protein
MKEEFAKSLARHLLDYYGRVPSASILARDFNFRVGVEGSQISQETARRWIRGISMPELDKLQVLVDWLNLEMSFMGRRVDDKGLEPNSTSNGGSTRPINQVEAALLQVFRETDLRGKRSILALADAIIPGAIPPSALARN